MAEDRSKKGRKFTDLNEIFEHNTKESLWLLIDMKVYDVTNYKHPGGKQIFLQNAGQDATTQFEDINHENADKYMPGLLIGYYEPPEDEDSGAPGILDKKDGSGDDDMMSRIFLAVAFAIVAYYLYTQVA
uniref:Cytochrome b5 heme-binding domain-containing protein n=1 Tax=Favella ehrenbergii TaxID=182087 RepID=A0A7S3MR49_9SPIT|mmetsp:Transcript_8090/g.9658  ORF Transcript_8090/g.9658 Transcript_8090/m.9658 type:complete len:130 (+) Transcript_8090:141-530(+)|eukprot:CAMPEP_0170466770 /NCGR_PEP_ID=MMETSP0123-20130129/10595_1 /TAXON_ID=182087 /ORGANISM="Favella ehrenbergii, Strain Fehren 1" /LENGTH=129 /DNA_ID=CAMNT_0010732961 /DNA_START=142 /DNA_END=531 /DNA_ORIENTATION=+